MEPTHFPVDENAPQKTVRYTGTRHDGAKLPNLMAEWLGGQMAQNFAEAKERFIREGHTPHEADELAFTHMLWEGDMNVRDRRIRETDELRASGLSWEDIAECHRSLRRYKTLLAESQLTQIAD